MFEWAYSGVDFSLAGNGGQECKDFLPYDLVVWETMFIVAFALFEIIYPWQKSVINYKPNLELRERFGRKLLLAALCLIWGIEIGYKLSSRQFIFLLNPCHVCTFVQVSLIIKILSFNFLISLISFYSLFYSFHHQGNLFTFYFDFNFT